MKLAERFHRARFDWEVRSILKTPLLQPGKENFIALSMVQHRGVLPYLLALKSSTRFLRLRRVVLIAGLRILHRTPMIGLCCSRTSPTLRCMKLRSFITLISPRGYVGEVNCNFEIRN